MNQPVIDLRLTSRLLGLVAASGALLATGGALAQEGDDETLSLTGVVRDFRERTVAGGHPDMERRPSAGFGLYCGNVAPVLGEDGKPIFTGNGFKVTSQWKDNQNRPICYLLYNSGMGDVPGTPGVANTGGVQSAATFAQWFTDVPGMNLSMPLQLTFVRQENGIYVFDDELDPNYSSLGGFFPIEDQLFGNPGGSPDRNFHFTFELHCEFEYDENGGQLFKFIGDDDVFVFVNGQLVIDLGGVHAATTQFVDMDRLGLTHGLRYTLDFFFAERHRTQSNFRIETNLPLEPIEVPATTAAFD